MFDFLAALIGPRVRLPQDQKTRISRSARKHASEASRKVQAAIDEVSGLPGLVELKDKKRAPKGFYKAVESFHRAYDEYAERLRERDNLQDAPRPGTPEGTGACMAAPFGVYGIESLNIYHRIRGWKDFPAIAQRLGELGEEQFKDIQEANSGKKPEKIRMNSTATANARLEFSKRGQPCPFLDPKRKKCRIWENRPIACRQHHITTDPAWSDPRHENHSQVKAKNLRLPLRQQATLAQIDRRMDLQPSPMLYAGVLQMLQLNNGELIQEVGEAPRRMGQDGRIAPPANRGRGKGKGKGKSKSKGKR